jgi:nucleoside-diphosphate-sugar epimerase
MAHTCAIAGNVHAHTMKRTLTHANAHVHAHTLPALTGWHRRRRAQREQPDTVVHFAEQRAAPYSQKGPREKRYTVDNNIGGTHNLCVAIVESGVDVHVVHLGTMGVYGYGNSGGEIPEGYIDVILPGDRKQKVGRGAAHSMM